MQRGFISSDINRDKAARFGKAAGEFGFLNADFGFGRQVAANRPSAGRFVYDQPLMVKGRSFDAQGQGCAASVIGNQQVAADFQTGFNLYEVARSRPSAQVVGGVGRFKRSPGAYKGRQGGHDS